MQIGHTIESHKTLYCVYRNRLHIVIPIIELIKLLSLCTLDTQFEFNEIYYRQSRD